VRGNENFTKQSLVLIEEPCTVVDLLNLGEDSKARRLAGLCHRVDSVAGFRHRMALVALAEKLLEDSQAGSADFAFCTRTDTP
jgi:hypothetical protein